MPFVFYIYCSKALQRAAILRAHGSHLPEQAFQARKSYLSEAFEKGTYLKDPIGNNKPKGNLMSDPAYVETMMDGMKKNIMNIVPQTVIMGWINFFFSGFVLSTFAMVSFFLVLENTQDKREEKKRQGANLRYSLFFFSC